MEQNLFTEGVRPGSVTTPEEVHMLICYIFREAGQPVTLDQANEVLQRQSLVNYFEFAEAAERLIRMGHLRPAENGRYTLSPEGEKLADTFRQKLPAAVRERAQRALDDVLTLLRRQQENKVRVKKVDVEERLLDETGKLHLEKAGLMAYSHGEYFAMGKKIGSFGYSVRKKRPKNPTGKRKK